MRHAALPGGKARILCPVRLANRLTKRLPLLVARQRNHTPVLRAAAAIGPMRGHALIPIAPAWHDAPIHRVVEDQRGEELQSRFELGHIDVLALAGPASMVEGGDEGGGRKPRD